MQSNVSITWYGHSCFKIECGNYSIVIDPFDSEGTPGYEYLNIPANKLLCSHQHHDHNCERAVQLLPARTADPFTINTIECAHDDADGKLRGMNTIHIIEAEGIKIAHFGDIGCELNDECIEKLGDIDIAMIPVGGHYTIDAVQAKKIIDRIFPTVTMPMHYRGDGFGYDVLATVNDYLKLCDDVIVYDTDTISVTKGMLKQTAILQGRAIIK